MKEYRKLIAAGVGLVILIGAPIVGFETSMAMEAFIAVLTIFGVYQIPNGVS